MKYDSAIINAALDYTRRAVGRTIGANITRNRRTAGAYPGLYDLLRDYPFRRGKSLRPALCIAMTRAVGGLGHQALTTSAALELYHNAFLIHDDIEDASEQRRGRETLHQLIGVPRAVNVGDATNVLAVNLLLQNLEVIGVAKALHVLHEIEHMARQSVEGQAMELDWVAANAFRLTDRDYYRMCAKKTCWYTFITPCRIGYIVGCPAHQGRDMPGELEAITKFGKALGIAFQIQDDLLNLEGEVSSYGKEIGGDIYEGKRTIMLNHVLRHAGRHAARIRTILKMPRRRKTRDHVHFIFEQMKRCGSLEHGRSLARRHARRAMTLLDRLTFLLPATPSRPGEQWESDETDRRFLKELVHYVVYREL